MLDMRRREFITLLGGAAAAWPLAARAQQPAMPVIGFLRSAPFDGAAPIVTAFRRGLKDTGFVEGENVVIEFRSADNRVERLPALVAELVRRPVTVIVGNTPAALAAKTVTTTVPIVFATGGDAVKEGFVASLNRPGGNVTGVSFLATEVAAKKLEMLREVVPALAKIAVLVNNNPDAVLAGREIEAAARALGIQVAVLKANNEREIEEAFAAFVRLRPHALFAAGGAFFLSRRDQLVTLANRHRVPAIYSVRDFVAAGGFMSYGASISDAYRQAGTLTGKILNGAKPADLPVQRSVRIELAINLKTAKALGLEVPPTLLARADEVIE